MKKFLVILFVMLILGFGGYYVYINYFNTGIPRLDTEEEKVSISKYYIYGNHLNLVGSVKLDDLNYKNVCLTLYNGEFKDFEIKSELSDNILSFSTSDLINTGIYLDNIEKGTYYLFLKVVYQGEEDKDINKYYVIKNDTDYKENTYYTFSKFNNKIVINSINDYETMMFDITENTDKDIYDITIDPGHGGMDSGGFINGKKESDITMVIARKIKENLEKENIKVKLTHEKDTIPKDDIMEEYGTHGRAVIPNEVKSKYTFSIHVNKNTYSGVRGVEVYTASGIDYELAKSIANSVTMNTELGYSTNKLYKKYDGVYTHNFTESEITSSLENYKKKNYMPYDITTNSNYLYMIRETGGIMTGAYVKEGNPNVGTNPYYNSNMGNESYLLELGYLSNSGDYNIIINSEEKLAKAVSDTIIGELNLEV